MGNLGSGFDEQVSQILEKFQIHPHGTCVISIVGTAGIGKTTLAKKVFHQAYIHYCFQYCAWVTVSQNYNANKVLQGLLNSLGVPYYDDEETVRLRERIFDKLCSCRCGYLIVVDDLWSKEAWDDLKQIFPDTYHRSRIVLTTRFKDVAHYAARVGFIHEIPFLNEDQSWSLLQQKVFLQEPCPPELEDIGSIVASKCGGLPLAILVIAGILSNNAKAPQYWEDIARNLNSSSKEEDDGILFQALSLSYDQLPDQLKALLLYLGSFQDGHEISVSTLAKLLVAEGLVKSVDVNKTVEHVVRECLEVLVKRNLVLITKKHSDQHRYKFCTLHDVVRTFSRRRACDENFFHVVQDQKDRLYTIELERCKLLRVLDVAETTPWSVLNAVAAQMFHLKCLSLHLESLVLGSDLPPLPPSISMLKNLHTLIIYHPSPDSLTLPPEIWKMTRLKHVIVTTMTLPQPTSTVSDSPVQKLEYLQTLSTVKDFIFTDEAIDMIPNLRKLMIHCTEIDDNSVWELYCLNNLVRLYHLEELQITLGAVSKSGLDFIWASFVFPLNLGKLSLGGCRLPWEEMRVVGSLPNLQSLKLRRDSFVGGLWEPTEGEFLGLRFLLLEMLDLKYWMGDWRHFPCLEFLKIRSCIGLNKIPLGIGRIPTLRLIEIYGSEKVEKSAMDIRTDRVWGNNYPRVIINNWIL